MIFLNRRIKYVILSALLIVLFVFRFYVLSENEKDVGSREVFVKEMNYAEKRIRGNC